ncbi:MAG: metallophosphoesterase [Planctomycetales bacterium]
MAVWAIADLHLSFGVEGKEMDKFGPHWQNHPGKIEDAWRRLVREEDLILIPGDVSWARTEQEAEPDLAWIHALPGHKLLLKGNHDYWWPKTRTQLDALLPDSISALHKHEAFAWNEFAVGGARLWDLPDVSFRKIIDWRPTPRARKPDSGFDDAKILQRELDLLRGSLAAISNDAAKRICITHYPPGSPELADSEPIEIIESQGIHKVVFGHLHSVNRNAPVFGSRNGVQYLLASADYINFTPIRIYS